MGSVLIKEGLQDRLFGLIQAAPEARSIQAKDWSAVGSLMGPRQDNQDRACVFHISYATRPADDLLVGVVCDGMGGMSDGGMAATLALSVFITELAASRRVGEERLRLAILEANRVVFNRLGAHGGTTLTAVAASPRGETWSVHVGDSRLYSYTPADFSLVSQDDTISGIVNSGDPDQIEDAQDNRLIQFVGMGAELQPHISKLWSGKDQSWILTSDGAHGLGRKMMRTIAANARSGVDLARKILFIVDAAPLGDNASVVALVPSIFEAPRRNRRGVNLTVWTPIDRLELWVDDGSLPDHEPPERSGEGNGPEAEPADKAAPLAKPRGKTKGKPKVIRSGQTKSRSSAGASKNDGGEGPPPLLNIVFGDEQDP